MESQCFVVPPNWDNGHTPHSPLSLSVEFISSILLLNSKSSKVFLKPLRPLKTVFLVIAYYLCFRLHLLEHLYT